MAGTETRQLLLQVDASVALAQRNLNALARQVDQNANGMDTSLSRVDQAFSRVGKSAEESAQAFLAGDRAAKQLMASIDPLYAAQLRYDNELEKANNLYRTGSLDAQQFAKAQTVLKTQYDEQVRALGRIAGQSGSARAGIQQLSYQVGDVATQFALGARPMQIFAAQGSQVIGALQLMGGEGNKFLSFLGGPWGVAITSAAVVLGSLWAASDKGKESTADLVKKMKEQADQAYANEQANKVWEKSLDGVREAQRKLRDEIDKSILSEQAKNQQELDNARDQLSKRRKELTEAQRDLAKAKADRDALGGAQAGGGSVAGAAQFASAQNVANSDAKIAAAKKRVEELTAAIKENEQTIQRASIPIARDYANANANASQAVSALTGSIRSAIESASRGNATLSASLVPLETALNKLEKAAGDAVSAGAKVPGFGGKIASLTRTLIEGKIGPDAYAKSLQALTKSLEAAGKAAKAAKTAQGEFGKQVDFAQAQKIAEAAGLKVNSAYRSTDKQRQLYNDPSVNRPGNPVAMPGTSAHEGANGKWALDIQITADVTPDKIRKVFASQGVRLTKVYKENGHYHIEGSRSEAASAETKAETERNRQVRNTNVYEERLDALNRTLLAAQAELVEGTEARAKYADILAKQAEQDANKAVDNDVEEGKLTKAQADALKAKNEEIRIQREKNIALNKQLQLARDSDEKQQQEYGFRVEELQFRNEMAKTADTQRSLQLEIIDLVYQQKQKHLEYLKAQAELVGNTEEAARIQAEINNLPAEKSRDQTRAREGTKGPMEQFFSQVPQSAEEMQQYFEQLKVQGIEGAIDSLVALGDGFESFRDTAINAIKAVIAELIRMQLMKLALNIFGAATGGISSSPLSFSDPGDLVGAMGPVSYGGIMGGLPGFASGGSFTIGGRGGIDNNLMAINGMPVAKVGRGETVAVIPKMPSVGVPRAANGNMRGGDSFHISVAAPNTGDPMRDRRTAMQQAVLIREQVSKAAKRGF